MLLAVVAGVAIAVLAVTAASYAARAQRRALTEVPPDDPNRCAACESTDVTHPAEGVYVCKCGFRGGPGLPAFAWKEKTARIAAMSPEDRDALFARSIADARMMLTAARGDFERAMEAFRQGEAIVPMGSHAANRKTELYDEVRESLPGAERYLVDAIGAVETVRHIRRGADRMTDWYDRLHGSRESALTLTGMQATAALGAQLREVQQMLTGLERELDS